LRIQKEAPKLRESEFWRRCGADFRALADEEDARVGARSDGYRLRAKGQFDLDKWLSVQLETALLTNVAAISGNECTRVGADSGTEPLNSATQLAKNFDAFRWTLESPDKSLKARFHVAATRAGIALKPLVSGLGKPMEYWLDRVRLDALHNVDYLKGDIITRVCRASENCCVALAKAAVEREGQEGPSSGADSLRMGAAEIFRREATKMLADGATHRQICQQLAGMPRPVGAAWRHLPWNKAYSDEWYRPSVAVWISRHCRD